MDIVFCLFKYFPFGGQQRDFYKIAMLSEQQGMKIHVLTSAWEAQNMPPPSWNVQLIQLKSYSNHRMMLEFSEKCDDYIQKNFPRKPLILGFTPMPFLTHYFQADRCFASRYTQLPWYLRLLPRYRIYLNLEKSLFHQGHSALILQLSALEKPLYQKYYQTENARFIALPPGISPDRKKNASHEIWRKELRKSLHVEHDFVWIQIGSGFKTKGLDRSIRAIAALCEPNVKLLVVGQDHKKEYQQLAQKLQIENQIIFLDGRDDIPKLLAASDALIHPARYENAGMAILEGMVAGLPVLCTDSCGYAKYILEAQCGLVLSSPFQQQDLNKATKELITGNNDQLRENALRYAEENDLYSLHQQIVTILLDGENSGTRKMTDA